MKYIFILGLDVKTVAFFKALSKYIEISWNLKINARSNTNILDIYYFYSTGFVILLHLFGTSNILFYYAYIHLNIQMFDIPI